MNTPTITEIREALAAAIAPAMRSSSYMQEKPQTPIAVVTGPEADFNEDSLSDSYTFPVLILVSDATQRQATLTLDAALSSNGATSVRAAIEADTDLGGVVQYALPLGIRDYGTHVIQNVEYLGAALLVQVVAYRALS